MKQFNLREEIKKMVMILSSIYEGIVIMDKNGQIIFFNPTAEIITAYLGADILEKKIDQVFKFQCEKSDVDDFFNEVLKGEQAVRLGEDCQLIRNDGRLVPVRMVASPIYDEIGAFQGSLIAFRDLTEEFKIKQRQREFLSFISHQLRMPLGSFRWGLEIILSEEKKLDPIHNDLLKDLYKVSLRLIDFVHSLVEISRLEAGRIQLNPTAVDVSKIVKEVFEELKNLAISLNIKAELFPSLQEGKRMLPAIFVDPERFRDIIRNLVSNALTYNRRDGSLVIDAKILSAEEVLALTKYNDLVQGMDYYLETILKKNSRGKEFLVLTAADTGIGIPKDQQSQIFSSFFRARNVASLTISGTGSGLYYTKAIVENSGGRIFFESEENIGTTFYLVFPAISNLEKD